MKAPEGFNHARQPLPVFLAVNIASIVIQGAVAVQKNGAARRFCCAHESPCPFPGLPGSLVCCNPWQLCAKPKKNAKTARKNLTGVPNRSGPQVGRFFPLPYKAGNAKTRLLTDRPQNYFLAVILRSHSFMSFIFLRRSRCKALQASGVPFLKPHFSRYSSVERPCVAR